MPGIYITNENMCHEFESVAEWPIYQSVTEWTNLCFIQHHIYQVFILQKRGGR